MLGGRGYVFDVHWGHVVTFLMPTGGTRLCFRCTLGARGGDVVMFCCPLGVCGYVFDVRWEHWGACGYVFDAQWGHAVMFLMPAGGMWLCLRCPLGVLGACGYVFAARWEDVVMFLMPGARAGRLWLCF